MNKLCLSMFCFLMLGCPQEVPHPEQQAEEFESSQITTWNQEVELFIEHQPFIAGVGSRLVTHVTHLKDWSPRREGEIQIIMSTAGKAPITLTEAAPARPGIYLPSLTFPQAGTWDLELRIPLEEGVSIEVIRGIPVYSSSDEVPKAEAADESRQISFLKEQQWVLPFESREVLELPFRESLQARGFIEAKMGGEVLITAPLAGRILSGHSALPFPGTRIEKGQKLAALLPRLDAAADPASLKQAVEKAELAYNFSQRDLERIRGLVEKQAIPKNRLVVAELELEKADSDLKSTKMRYQQLGAGLQEDEQLAALRVDLVSPISGTLMEVAAVPGAQVAEGERLFRVVDLDRVWLRAQIPESEIGRIGQGQGAWFRVEGLDRIFELDLESGDRFIAAGGEINSRTRTLPLVYEMANPDGLLKIGMSAAVNLATGQEARGPSIPYSLIMEESGQSIAYVQLGGESFERRVLRLGIRDGERVQVLEGLVPGERVVTQGGYQIGLSASSSTIPAHGHEH